MTLAFDYGPIIESGKVDDATYELRGEDHPMLYVYRKVDGAWWQNAGQLGGLSVSVLARMLLVELPKAKGGAA